jgi:hypothetical protein
MGMQVFHDEMLFLPGMTEPISSYFSRLGGWMATVNKESRLTFQW